MKQTFLAMTVGLFLSVNCVSAEEGGPNTHSGIRTAGQGLVHLILSPVQITAGFLEGVASLPYYAATGLHTLNQRLNDSQAQVTLADTYGSAYGKDLRKVSDDGDTGQSFRRMKDATEMFQKILKEYGIKDHQNYILTSIDTAKNDGFVLFAVVYRPAQKIAVMDRANNKTRNTFDSADRLFYEPFELDANGTRLDVVVDFGGVPIEQARTQKMQAVLLTLAANSVARGDRKPEYWEIQRRWIRGEHREIVQSRQNDINQKLGIK
ncbi:MAG: hypothetical protein K8S54_18015 [Spirochaetia bacterium]|nr:hypothetical protein [Spirochaetia bacterium]